MQLFSEYSRRHSRKQEQIEQQFLMPFSDTKITSVLTQSVDPFLSQNTIPSSQRQAPIKIPNSSTTLDFTSFKQDCFQPPIIHSISISCIDGFRRFAQFNETTKNSYKPNSVPVNRQFSQKVLTSSIMQIHDPNKQLLLDYQSFQNELLYPKNSSILNKKSIHPQKLCLMPGPQKQLKPIFMSLSSKLKKKTQNKVQVNKYKSYLFCCGSWDNVDQYNDTAIELGKKKNYYRK